MLKIIIEGNLAEGKTTLARIIDKALIAEGYNTISIESDKKTDTEKIKANSVVIVERLTCT